MESQLAELFARQINLANVPSTSTSQSDTGFPLNHTTFPYALSGTSDIYYHDFSRKAPGPLLEKLSERIAITDGRPITSAFRMFGHHEPERLSLTASQSELAEKQQSRVHQTWETTPNIAHVCSEDRETKSSQQGEPIRQNALTSSILNSGAGEGHSVSDMDMALDDEDDYDFSENAEPYMASGYEALARREYELSAIHCRGMESVKALLPKEPTTGFPYRPASDPVYRSHGW